MDSELTERPKNICDTCGQPYAVNANYDKHDCRLEPAKVWLEENVWSEGDTQEETAANLKALLDSEIAEWLTDFATQHTADLSRELAEANARVEAAREALNFGLGLINLAKEFDINIGKGWGDFEKKANAALTAADAVGDK